MEPVRPARIAAILMGGLLLLGVGSIGAYLWTHRATGVDPSIVAVPSPVPSVEQPKPPAEEAPVVVAPSKVEEKTAKQEPAVKPSVEKRPAAGKTGSKKPPPEEKSESTGVSKGILPTGTGNPFDRRL